MVGATDPKKVIKILYFSRPGIVCPAKGVVKQFNKRPEVLAEIEKASSVGHCCVHGKPSGQILVRKK